MTSSGSDFAEAAGATLDAILRAYPETATRLGDHRFDDRLEDRSPTGLESTRSMLSERLRVLDAIGRQAVLQADDEVDRQVLVRELRRRAFDLDVLETHTWDPMAANPGSAIYALLARDFAPVDERLRAVAARLRLVPEALRVARGSLGTMSRVHVETAIGQFTGTLTLLATQLQRAIAAAPHVAAEVDEARDATGAAIEQHVAWLRARVPASTRNPRLGPDLYRRRLALALDTDTEPDDLLARAEADLERVETAIVDVAAKLDRLPADAQERVRRVLARLALDAPVDDATVVERCRDALATATAFVADADLVTGIDDPVEIVVMPEIHRGVAVAYCDPPGPLETTRLPTYFAVSPTPSDWPQQRVASFYREYNGHMLHNLTVHEAMPGHALQLAHGRRHRGTTPVRAAFWSGAFVEGWAVLAEELMADAGYPGAGSAPGLRMQQLKMQLRMIINTILDVGVHCHGMTRDDAMQLMTTRGHQEEGEATGKWRRALLTSAQLPTYYVGWAELRRVRDELRRRWPHRSAREVNDELLAHGSPSPRHLRVLLGTPPYRSR